MTQKKEIRKHYFNLRKTLSSKEVESRSTDVCNNFIQNLLPSININDDIFSLYFSAYNEVDTNLIAKHFIDSGINFSYPKIIAKDSPLKFVRFSKDKKIVNSEFYKDVKEIDGNQFVEANILIIPLVSFDSNKMRLGMGGGFFDRTIGEKNNVTTIALAYDFQLFDGNLPKEEHDKKVDYVVTQTQIFS